MHHEGRVVWNVQAFTIQRHKVHMQLEEKKNAINRGLYSRGCQHGWNILKSNYRSSWETANRLRILLTEGKGTSELYSLLVWLHSKEMIWIVKLSFVFNNTRYQTNIYRLFEGHQYLQKKIVYWSFDTTLESLPGTKLLFLSEVPLEALASRNAQGEEVE